jgi:A/G-specific adenine glycosylase
MRLFSRLFDLKKEVNSIGLKNQIKFIGDKLISKSKPGNFNQALMDFGSMVCSPKNYKCGNCIFSKDCIAFQNNTIDLLPLKKTKARIKTRYFNYLIGLSDNDRVKIIKRNKKDIWQDLYEFPLVETNHEIDLSETEKKFEKIGYFNSENVIKKLKINHKLTHQNLHIYFWIFKTNFEDNNFIKINDLESYPFPKPLFEIISQIK